ncbi:polyhydroxyalkanoic acid system family protein [Sphingomonas sp. AOB5]|uniref:polyhydroxyalkanoic acid system family protein n=1 Tax=Sphingomonas sp. AOB5 TaxID=3034017 RepID=UPI0023F8140E|nr:polyhydroxyalkanoic acid system family protein [Sphingomonas sp. AOB5]MDF7773805.1 polyhydroxyalkanoic acid system family protein [Sphingomonas sp. AOB5]
MPEPIKVDIPHNLGREAAKARMAGGVGKLADMVPGGGTVNHRWEGDTLHFTVTALGQTVASRIEVFDNKVHAEVDLPPMLALFAGKVRDKLMQVAPKLLK